MQENKKKILKKVLNVVFISAILFVTVYALFKNLDVDTFIKTFQNINWIYCILSIPVAILSHWIRAVRWRIFLTPIKHITSTINLFSAVMVGYLINNVTPRGGEFVRPFVLARRENISKSAVFATILVERFIDVIFLMIMFGIVFFASKILILKAFPWINTSFLELTIVGIFAIVIFLLVMLLTNIIDKLLQKILTILPKKYHKKIDDMWVSFKNGFAVLKTPKLYIETFLLSALIWILYAVPNYLMFFAFDFQTHTNLGLIDAGLLVVVSGIGMSIAPVPGGIGVYHWIVSTAIVNLYPQVTSEEALAYATISHGINLLIQLILGGAFMMHENIKKIPNEAEISD